MSKTQATPGPWRVLKLDGRWIVGILPRRGPLVYVADCGPAFVPGMAPDETSERASTTAQERARLIAAAPQMREALETALPYLHKMHADGANTAIPVEKAIAVVRAALRAANGETEKE